MEKLHITLDYKERILRVIQHVEQNLDHELNLDALADIANFSPFHFHRIFKSITSETPNEYITRKRIEKAAATLIRKPEVPISVLAAKYGFNSHSAFTRSFKKYYGSSPLEFKKSSAGKLSKICKTESKNGQPSYEIESYICDMEKNINWLKERGILTIEEVAEISLAYVSHVGVNGIDKAFHELFKWARPLGLMENPSSRVMIFYHDSFKITGPEKVRMSVSIKNDEQLATGGGVGTMVYPPCKIVKGHFELLQNEFEMAWSNLFAWVIEQGYTIKEQAPYGVFYNDFREHPEKKSIVDLCIPIT